MTRSTLTLILTLIAALGATACQTKYIKGTLIQDTEVNRQLLKLIETYRQALEDRDADGIVALCSERYFEDMGTARADDDYGYTELVDKVIKESFKHTDKLYVTITIDDIIIGDIATDIIIGDIATDGGRANVDIRFDYRAHLTFPAGDKWVTDTEFNRLELVKEAGLWKILSGL